MKKRNLSPANVLLLFRDGTAFNGKSLCDALDVDPDFGDTPGSILEKVVKDLLAVNLLVAADGSNVSWFVFKEITLKLSDNVPEIFTVLNLSLKEMAATNLYQSMFVEPSFGRPDSISPEEQLDLFVLMPFSPHIKGVYEDHIKGVATSLKLRVARADDFFAAHTIMKVIWTAICTSRVIIADCTGRNPNVFYEIGLAHTVGKPVVLITQNSEDVPFDLAHYRHISYEYTPRGMKKFESTLANALQAVFREL